MFFKNRRVIKLENKIEDLEIERDRLRENNSALVHEIEEKNHKKQMVEDEIKHSVKMRDQARDLEMEKYQVNCDRERDKAIAEVKDEYRDKMEKQLSTERDNIKSMYSEILHRLPTVSVKQYQKD